MATTRVIEGSGNGKGLRVGIVVARFNDLITQKLLDGCLSGLHRHGVAAEDVTVAWVAGSFEVPVVCKAMARSGAVDAVVCLGAVIKGATAHFDYVAGGAASGIMNAQLDTLVPCIFGVLTTDTLEQAFDRAGGKMGNKGYEAALTAIETANTIKLVKKLPSKL